MTFEVITRDGGTLARRGRFTTGHGVVSTPAFLPVGTAGAVKMLAPGELRSAGVEMILANAYHLWVRPGEEVIERLGGLHHFMGWDGPILTDSGGFQIFSMPELVRVTDEGAHFRSHVDGKMLFLSPEKALSIQESLEADVMMTFDECVAYPCSKERADEAARRTVSWARRSREAWSRKACLLFAIVQGSTYSDLRRRCAKELVEMDFPGYAVGGLAVGEERSLTFEILRETAGALPLQKPRYLMGVGPPLDIAEAVALGVDLFDCVIPTRNGRNGMAFTSRGVVRVRNEKHQCDASPLDGNCKCECCKNYSLGYLRHLFLSKEALGPRLLSLHNVHYYQEWMRRIREAIQEGKFDAFLAAARTQYPETTTELLKELSPEKPGCRVGGNAERRRVK